MISAIKNALKGYAIGAANVVPGVSGGTMAFLLGVYERLLNAIKGVNGTTLKLLLRLKIKEFFVAIDGGFLCSIFFGVALSFITLAKLLKWGFEEYPLYVWSIFFGLICASVPSLLKEVKKWTVGCLLFALTGVSTAGMMAFLTPLSENTHVLYLMICGVVAMASMIIPGLSGSFVLLLLGNYKLIMLDSMAALSEGDFNAALTTLVPVGVGAVLGVLVLARLLSWLFKTYYDLALSLIGGFVAGSLAVIWPWKDAVVEEFTKVDGAVKEKIMGFDNWRLPNLSSTEDWIAIAFCAGGMLLLCITESLGKKKA